MKRFFIIFISIIIGYTVFAADKTSIVYVSTDGNDFLNNGTINKPYKTIKKALISTGNDATIIIRSGDYSESINISERANRRNLTIKSYPGERVRLLCGERIESAEKVSGYKKVLKSSVSLCSNSLNYKIFQHDIVDKETFISPEERHPLQKGKFYRCNSTPLNHVTNIKDIESAQNPAFYYDEKNKLLYFSIVEGTSLDKNPIYLPKGNGLYGGNNEINLTVIGIEILYAPFNLSRCPGAKIIDCAVKYAFAGGGFMYHMSTGIEFIRCEAARVFTESGNGDGFNGHAYLLTENHPQAKHTTVSLTDCWAHDNYDDGYSNHERCEGIVRGGLFEYNGKYGVGSGYGVHESAFNVIARKNRYGFAICADVLENEGGYASQMVAHNCISENNTEAGYLIYTSNTPNTNPNSMILYDCYSFNNKIGFEVQDNSILKIINCKDSNSKIPYKGNLIIETFDNLK